jgi:hypothetical protein
MKRFSARTVFTSCLLLAAIGFAFLTLDLSSTSRRVPLLVLIPLLGLLFLELKRDLQGVPSDGPEAGESRSPREVVTPAAERRTLLWVLALPALVQLFGIVAGPGGFALLYFRVRGKEPWRFALAAAALTAAGLWVLFGLVLQTSVRAGIPLFGSG